MYGGGLIKIPRLSETKEAATRAASTTIRCYRARRGDQDFGRGLAGPNCHSTSVGMEFERMKYMAPP